MAPKKGQTNNPLGRPPKGRAIAERLSAALRKSYTGKDGKKHSGISVFADVLIRAVLFAEVELPNGKRLDLSPREWAELSKWVAVHVDGPAKSELGLDHAGSVSISVEYADGIDPEATETISATEGIDVTEAAL